MNNNIDKKVKVVVPLYREFLDKDEESSLMHNTQILCNYHHTFIIPQDLNCEFLNKYLTSNLKYNIIKVSDEWLGQKNGIMGYNRMCLSTDFYRLFIDTDYILICQTDAWVFRDELEEWCCKDYDYIGGIWWRKGFWSLPFFRIFFPKNRKLYGKVGNGGFSLRRVESHLRETERLKKRIDYYLSKKHHMYSEDIFWAVEPKSFKYPDMVTATKFAFDNHPDRCWNLINKLPFACHGWTKPNRRKFWEQYIP
mgnify:FL=1